MHNTKISLTGLIALIVGSMLGSGLFDLPSNVAARAVVGPILIALSITFLGMMSLVCVFKDLSSLKPELNAGIYAYAKEGFGNYIGFNSAWGYWISAWIGNIAFITMLCAATFTLLPALNNGTNIPSLILSSVIIWSINALCISGIKSATYINIITSTVKLLALGIFFLIILYYFDFNLIKQNLWPENNMQIIKEVKSTMFITLWVFIGIEGANVFSMRAKRREDIGKATIIGFLIVFCILLLISILPFGLIAQQTLSLFETPSTAKILESVIGKTGSQFISFAIIISILGALLSWNLLASEVPYVAAYKDNLFPKIFARLNSKGSPYGSLYITAIIQQIYLIISTFNNASYLHTISFATSMILLPYLFTACYALKLSILTNANIKQKFIYFVAVLYCVWLIYASGIKYVYLSSSLYAIGMIIYIYTRISTRQKVFTLVEYFIAGGIVLLVLINKFSNFLNV